MLRKKISILLTAAMLAGLMTGCGSAEKNPVESSMTGESTEAQTGEESAGDSGEQAEETDLSGQEPYTVRIVADGFGSEEACAEIGAAVSEITKAKFNTEVEIVRYDLQPMWIKYRQSWLPVKKLICWEVSLKFQSPVLQARGRLLH